MKYAAQLVFEFTFCVLNVCAKSAQEILGSLISIVSASEQILSLTLFPNENIFFLMSLKLLLSVVLHLNVFILDFYDLQSLVIPLWTVKFIKKHYEVITIHHATSHYHVFVFFFNKDWFSAEVFPRGFQVSWEMLKFVLIQT